MTSEPLVPLLVAVPLLAAVFPVALGGRWDGVGWPVATVAMVVQTTVAALVTLQVAERRWLVHHLGGFPPPFGIELVVDGLSAVVVLLVAAVSLWVLVYARGAGPHSNGFYTLFLLLVGGLSGMTVTADLFNLYVFLEITGLAAYGLVAVDRSGEAAIAALKYLVVGTFGASLYLLGVGYAFVGTGTLNMADFARLLGETVAPTSPLALAAFGLVVAGFSVKVALFPVHTWQPNAYQHAHDTVSVHISALVSTVSAYALVRVVFSAFTVDFLDAVPLAADLLVYAAGVSVVAGSALAVTQTDVKRMLAYSSVSQFGLIVMAVGLATELSVTGGVIHLVGHAVMKGGLFAAAGVLAARHGARRVDEYDGLAERSPYVAGAFAVLALGMIGIPPTVGFVGKLYIVLGALAAGSWYAVVVALVSTLLTLMYFWRVVQRLYFLDAPAGEEPAGDAVAADGGRPPVTTGMVAAVVVAALAAVALGFAAPAVESLLEPTLVDLFGLRP